MIELRDIHKSFGKRTVLTDVGFSVAPGEVVGFVGPNGAGKTTTLRILTGFLDPDRGTVEINGISIRQDRARAVGLIGYMPEATPLYGDMRVEEFLSFRARLKGLRRGSVGSRVDAVTRECGLTDERRRLIGQLSKGFRQRVGLADALLAEPPILILDEPTSGLDPVQVRELRGVLKRLARDRTVLLSSHILPEIERVASRVIVMVGGRVVADGAPATLRDGLSLPDDANLEDVFVALAGDRARPPGEATSDA